MGDPVVPAGPPVHADAATVRRTMARLGLPAIADLHVHFMPPRVMAAVWRYFDQAGPLLGRPWPVRYRGTDDERVAFLRDAGVGLFAGLSYAHKPDMARFLTDWSLEFADEVPEAVATGTFFPEPGVADYVADAIQRGCRLFKIHLQVGDFDPRDVRLRPVWDLLSATGIGVVVHAGSGPVPGRFTGPGPWGEVMREHPDLPAVIAHFGSPDEREFVDVALRYPNVVLDTTMVDTDFMGDVHRMDPGVLPAVRDLGLAGRVVFGTDYPNIPYAYSHQLEVLERWELGDDWLRAVLWDNPVRLVGPG